jgi:hypothetical protein
MLVTLGTNTALAGNGSRTFPYACRSVQKILIKVDDSTGNTAWDHYVTVQLGNRTIVNGAYAFGLLGMSVLQGGDTGFEASIGYQIDLGSHQLLDNENLYVTVRAGANALDAVDVSAVVNDPVGEFPIRYTEYSDSTFTAENVKIAISYAFNTSAVDEDASNIEIRDNVNSSSPSLISANNWFFGSMVGSNTALAQRYGLLCKKPVPLTTTFNYSSATTNRILVASQMGTSQRAIRQGKNQSALAQSQVGK